MNNSDDENGLDIDPHAFEKQIDGELDPATKKFIEEFGEHA